MLHWKPGGGLAPDRSRKNEGTFRYPPFAPTYTPFHLHRSRNPRCFCLEVRKLQILVLCINTILAQRGSWTWRPFFWGFHNLQGNVRSPNHGFCWAKNKWGKKNMVQAKRNSRLVGDESSSLLVFWMASRSSVSWRARSWRQDSSDFPKSCRFASYSVIITALSNIIDQYDSHLL